jgi:putative hydrolase of the HAD superfamily
LKRTAARELEIRAVLLDAAGTLITTAEPVGETYARWARKFGAVLSPETLDQGFRQIFPGMPAMAFPGQSGAALVAQERDWWRRLVRQVLDIAGGGVANFEEYFEAVYHHFASPDAWHLYPEVDPFLRQLRAEGYLVAVVSNFDSRLPVILEGLGLAPYLQVVVFSTAAGAAKPDQHIFRLTLRHLGLTPAQAVHVGDGLEPDYRGARGAGLNALLLQRSGRAPAGEATCCIRDLEELLPLLSERRKP